LQTEDSTTTTYFDLFQKCYDYHDAEIVREKGIYPYFQPIQSAPGDEVVVDGHKVIMVGSNN
jgi:hypothetical protein